MRILRRPSLHPDPQSGDPAEFQQAEAAAAGPAVWFSNFDGLHSGPSAAHLRVSMELQSEG